MNCERCGQPDAIITYTEYAGAEARTLRICETCARRLGFEIRRGREPGTDDPAAESPSVPGELFGVLSIEATLDPAVVSEAPEEDDPRECPGCGMTGNELRRQPRFGCASCYETFNESLDPLLRRIHGAVRHRGRLPGGKVARPVDAESLRGELAIAIANEDFEAAAKIRDRLRRADPDADLPEEDGPAGERTS